MHNRYWFLLSKKLSGNATDAELAELDELLHNNPDWQYPAEHLARIWDGKTGTQASDDDFAVHLNRMEKLGHDTTVFAEKEAMPVANRKLFSRTFWLRTSLVAASLLVVVTCWLVLGKAPAVVATQKHQLADQNVVVTKSGDRRKMLLPDGTQVWLNAESKLAYGKDFGKKNRDVTLSGEAYFDVVKNTELPFTIQTKQIRIKVTGTAFNVKAYPGDKVSETSIIRGRVEVTINERPDEKYILKPNEKLVVRNAPLVKAASEVMVAEKKMSHAPPLIQLGYLNYIENDSAAVETSWVYDRLIFDDETFGEIAKKMERWYGVQITISDNQLASQQLTYTIKKETVSQALRNMQYALRFNYSFNGNTITITK